MHACVSHCCESFQTLLEYYCDVWQGFSVLHYQVIFLFPNIICLFCFSLLKSVKDSFSMATCFSSSYFLYCLVIDPP